MNEMQRGVITLLKSAVTEQPLPLPEGFDLEAAWPQLKKHHMAALLYDGAVRCGIPRETPVMKLLFQSYCRSLLVSEGQLQELQRVQEAFDRRGIDYLPLKGINMKSRYPKPELRSMGDGDILIRLEQREQIDQILPELGFQFQEETDHELVWKSKRLHLELHKHLIPSYNKDYHPYFGTGWQLARHEKLGCHAMTAEDEFLFLFAHFAKHFRDGGIGCRYVTDLWVFLRSFPELDENRILRELETLELGEFYGNIRQLIRCWFEEGTGSEKLDVLTDFIFDSGSWGRSESQVLSRAVRDGKHLPSGIRGRLLYLWQTAFPPAKMLRGKYCILKKHPWLLPLVWVLRPFYKMLFEFRSLEKQKRNLSALSRENLADRQTFLRYVGLDYRF